MHASPANIIDYFNGEKQNLIPLFQRPYRWSEEKWNTRWEDVMIQYELGETANHFMGAIVSVPARSIPVGVSKFLIIDGQQRLTTISLLLCALRDCVEARTAERIQEVYLTNRHREPEDTLKFVPTQADRDAFRAIALDRQVPTDDALVSVAYRFFVGKLKNHEDTNGDPVVSGRVLSCLERALQVDATAHAVLKRFSALVRTQIDLGKIPFDAESRFRAIAWNTTWPEKGEKKPGKMRLVDFYPDFNRAKSSKEPEPASLAEWVRDHSRSDATMRGRESGIMGVFVKILRAEGVRNPTFKIPFTRSTLLGYLKDKHADYYATLRLQVYKWCLAAANGETEAVVKEVRAQVPKLLGKLNATCKETKDFVEGDGQAKPSKPKVDPGKPNIVSFDGFDIRLESVHAVKGQTHTATVYFESAFYGAGATPRAYESQRLDLQFLGKGFPKKVGVRTGQSAKVVFVGFSRPTHFLCFAVHKDRFDNHLKDAAQHGWTVEEVV